MKLDRVLVGVLRPLVHLIFPHKCYGKENYPKPGEGVILCCNHISYLDPVFLMASQKRTIRFMAKAEFFESRFMRWAIGKQFGGFPVERGKGDTKALDTAVELVEKGEILGIFPEGTRSKTGELGRIKSGTALIAARARADIIPAVVVTRGQKVRAFRRSKVIFGKKITLDELHLTDPDHPDLRYASRLIGQRFAEMIGEAKERK
ncbi:MAG: lysophospholipid acyltransferase family protein [Acutalibacteraceae bacterium]|jgi:1-acyl-sn-glycerol-3-phosphate acyltransferase